MAELIACCGLVCQTCPIHLATRVEDKVEQLRMRAVIARECHQRYNLNYEPGDIGDCDGCGCDGRLFSGSQGCTIRKCVRQRDLENCAHCPDYVCKELQAFFDSGQGNKKRLDELRLGLNAQANLG